MIGWGSFRVTAIGTSDIRVSAVQPSAAGTSFLRPIAEEPSPESPTTVAVTRYLEFISIRQPLTANT